VRLLRSQLRQKGSLRVDEGEALALNEVAAEQAGVEKTAVGSPSDTATSADSQLPAIREERDLAAYEKNFSNAEYWKKNGEDHQNALIVTGTILFRPHTASGFVQRETETYYEFGRRRVSRVRAALRSPHALTLVANWY
jgi:hypothetical protein